MRPTLVICLGIALSLIAPRQIRAQDVQVSGVDRQAAYCMQAELGFARRLTGLAALLQKNEDKIQTALSGPNVTDAQRPQLQKDLDTLKARISDTANNAEHQRARVTKIQTYLTGRGLLLADGLHQVNESATAAQEDQAKEQKIFHDCAADCKPGDQSCKSACDTAAESSEPAKRLTSCDEFADQLP